MRMKKGLLAAILLFAGALIILYGVFAPMFHKSDDYVLDYNEGVKNFELSMESGRYEYLVTSLENFQAAFPKNSPSNIKSAILYNMATVALESPLVEKDIDVIISELKEAGRYDSNDMDVKYNLDILLGLKGSSSEGAGKGEGGESEGEGGVSPMPILGQDPDGTISDYEDMSDLRNKFDEKVGGGNPADADSEPDF